MSVLTSPRGPLPPRVYWARRALVLLVALTLVFGIGRWLGAGGDGGDGAEARVVVAHPTPTATATRKTAGAKVDKQPGKASTGTKASQDDKGGGKPAKPTPTPLAAPTGPCQDSDVVVTPVVAKAYAGRDVSIVLELTTIESPACTWQVTAESVVLKVTSGSDRIWTSQECSAAIPKLSVVPRKAHAARVTVVWNGQRSRAGCPRTTPWALPGWYHAEAVARGSETPADLQFELLATPRATVTATPKPKRQQ